MIKSHKHLTASLLVSAALAVCLGVISPQLAVAASLSSSSSLTASAVTGIIESSVRLRITPSTSGTVLSYLKEGEIVTILEKTNSYWYKVRTATGTVGYTSSGEQYISLVAANPGGSGTVTPVPTAPSTPPQGTTIERVITAGMKYLGTPYEFGSSRSNTNTFDCSDFIRQVFLDAANLQLPADSRQQGDWVKQNGTAVTNISALKRGDLMFFMDYKGSSVSAYAGIDKSTARISHVAMYLGNGQILHTYSISSGGVRVDNLSASWMNRFLFGGSVIR
ncbi:C40 family peptidase [Paenibacillus sp. 19GGS1-52]|uniref:C40 family peptidase n=1 Tax=Paenibacillus sp. 19GGS1-52 TaxID=2758563 RepID=UPI001EFA691C|nr:C40 family peptidase [Paenibacillus sp. 19GGS1-52]ULO08254.1 C40 family peptidase [Paenibacillus sp. 19GGS1-52]